MRNTPVLIPIILAICIGTLAYLLYAAFSTSAAPLEPRVQLPRVDADYSARPTDDLGRDPVEDLEYTEREAPAPAPSTYDRPAAQPEAPVYREDEQVANEWTQNNNVAREVTADRAGRYVVLAGSFRQLANAERQTGKLRKAGFAEAEVIKSTGGAYAMAMVGRRSAEAEANRLMAQVKAKGFDARVVKR